MGSERVHGRAKKEVLVPGTRRIVGPETCWALVVPFGDHPPFLDFAAVPGIIAGASYRKVYFVIDKLIRCATWKDGLCHFESRKIKYCHFFFDFVCLDKQAHIMMSSLSLEDFSLVLLSLL